MRPGLCLTLSLKHAATSEACMLRDDQQLQSQADLQVRYIRALGLQQAFQLNTLDFARIC